MASSRVIVVTGASTGIGAAILKDQASKGHTVVGIARRAELIQEIQNQNKEWKVHALKADFMKEEEIVKAFSWIKTNLQRVDVLINNAGVMINTDILKGEIDHWRTMFNVNVFAPGVCIREVLPLLAEDGHIVNISSIVGISIINYPDYLIYSSTKHALKVINEGIRMALAKEKPKVRLTILSPGLVKTDLSACLETDLLARFKNEAKGAVPIIQPEDVAKSVDHVINTSYFCNVTELTVRATTEVI